jgi:hypothetical protein
MSKVQIKESDIRRIVRKIIAEQEVAKVVKQDQPKARCTNQNIVPLDKIVGTPDDFNNYTSNVSRRIGGISGIVDALDILRTLRLHPHIKDKGEHIAFDLMNQLKEFNNQNYFDDVNGNCLSAMDKVIELYKENEHGEELVKDIEKVLGHSHPSPKAKEYLKNCILLIKPKKS